MYPKHSTPTLLLATAAFLFSCAGSKSGDSTDSAAAAQPTLNANGEVVNADSAAAAATEQGLPFSDPAIKEHVVLDYGHRTLRTDADQTLSTPEKMKSKSNCFIVMSKKDYYLYVYEPQGADTVLLARYDCAFSLRKGQKERSGDMKTPHCTLSNPFSVQQIQDAASWSHDFGDGRGSIKSYGDYFLRLRTPGHSGIGIHGSTNNRESVPGRASEGCIRLKDEDIKDLAENYATEGMKVIIKAEDIDDYPFEIHAFKKQNISRKRHFNPANTLTNEQIAAATPEQGRGKETPANADGADLPAAGADLSNTTSDVSASTKRVRIVNADVRLRLGAGTDKEVLKDADGKTIYAKVGETLPYKAEMGNWYMVDYKGKTVYVQKNYARPE